MWQVCPLCKGSGKDPNITLSNSTGPDCSVCEGAKIISQLTGRPPTERLKVSSGVDGGGGKPIINDLTKDGQPPYNGGKTQHQELKRFQPEQTLRPDTIPPISGGVFPDFYNNNRNPHPTHLGWKTALVTQTIFPEDFITSPNLEIEITVQ